MPGQLVSRIGWDRKWSKAVRISGGALVFGFLALVLLAPYSRLPQETRAAVVMVESDEPRADSFIWTPVDLSDPLYDAGQAEAESQARCALQFAGVVAKGHTISRLLGERGIPYAEVMQVVAAAREHYDLSRLMPGRSFSVDLDEQGGLCLFEYSISREEKLRVLKKQDAFSAMIVALPVERRTVIASGRIKSSLFDAVREAGENPGLALMLADLFAWEVDFLRDLRSGDTFRVIVEKQYLSGSFSGYGRVLAAQITVAGQERTAFYYGLDEETGGYYHPDGSSVRRQFLKAPLSFSRISSRFTARRYHPILKRNMPHHGTDYAASYGTPVRSVGDGTVVKCTSSRTGGKMIEIRHPNGFKTAYLHLSRFAAGMDKGKRISQGQIIGYVGSTGLATGPHLCYRIYKNGKPVNPQSIKSPPAEPLPPGRLPAFRERIAAFNSVLETVREEQIPFVISCNIPGADVY